MTRYWLAVARKDFGDSARSWVLWLAVALFTVVTAGMTVAVNFLPMVEATASMAFGIASQFAATIVPITALVAAYLAIAGERETGSIKILLGLPPTRLDVLVGKLVGRAAVVVVAVVLAFALAGAVAVPLYGDVSASALLSVTALTALLGLSFVAIAVGVSAAAATRARAMAAAIAFYVLTVVMWDFVPLSAHFLVTGELPGETVPSWYLLLTAVTPTGAYNRAVEATLTASGAAPGSAQLAGATPFYLEGWFMVLLLVAWGAVPLALGYLRFRASDLG